MARRLRQLPARNQQQQQQPDPEYVFEQKVKVALKSVKKSTRRYPKENHSFHLEHVGLKELFHLKRALFIPQHFLFHGD